MKKWHFPVLFLTILAAVAIGLNFGTLYDSIMLSVTGDCRYWHAKPTSPFLDAQMRNNMSNKELNCALGQYVSRKIQENDYHASH